MMANREMKNSGIPWIGDIPKDWDVCLIKQIMRNKSIKGYPNEIVLSLYRDYGVIPKDSRSDNHNVTSEDTSSYKFVEVGDFVINKMKAWQGSMAVSDYQGIISPAYYICRFTTNEIDRKYIHYLLRNDTYKAEYMRLSSGMRVGQWDLNIDDFLRIQMVLPPLSEQTKIASFLDRKCAEIDEMIALQEKIVEELKAYKQSVITEAVTKGLNPDIPMKDSRIEWIGEIPKHWEVGRMKNVCSQNPNSLSEKTDKDIEFDYVDIGSVSFEKGVFNTEHYKFSEAPSRARRKANFGDFIMSTVRTYLRAIDVIDTQEKANYIYSTGFAVLTPKAHISYKFLSYISKSQYFLEQVTTLSRGINYPSINSTDLMTICVVHPSIEEQIQISDYLDAKCTEIDNLISIKLSKIDSLKEYKKSIIYEYVTGKKEITL